MGNIVTIARKCCRRGAALVVAAAAMIPACAAAGASGVVEAPGPPAVMNPAARETFELVNAQRLAHGLAPLKVSARCVAAAQDLAESQAGRRELSHDSLTESFAGRMERWGLLRWPVAENLGRGPTASAVVDSWMKSRIHRANILNPKHVSAGTGAVGDTYALCLSGDPGL